MIDKIIIKKTPKRSTNKGKNPLPSTSKTPASKHAATRSESIGSYGSLDKMFSTRATKRRIDLLDSSDEEVDHMEENLGGKLKQRHLKD